MFWDFATLIDGNNRKGMRKWGSDLNYMSATAQHVWSTCSNITACIHKNPKVL